LLLAGLADISQHRGKPGTGLLNARLTGAGDFNVDVVRQLGIRIRELRTTRSKGRMTQEDLAEKADISVSFLSMIERGERAAHVLTLQRLADGLGVEMAELFQRAPKTKRSSRS
jgi:ribosome-binding protein aMBF1 (putative translation factor)